MLQSLHVHNFALIEDAKVDFDRGFTVFTGETGAGKSILVDAFGIALGGRAAAGMVRSSMYKMKESVHCYRNRALKQMIFCF